MPKQKASQQTWVESFRAATQLLGLPADMDAHLYRLRHGGASHDTAHRVRSLDEVAKRGAWLSLSIVFGIRHDSGRDDRQNTG